MIVRGPERRKQDSNKNYQVGPTFSPIDKMVRIRFGIGSQPEGQTPQSKHQERYIGNYVSKIGDTEKTALVSEIVVCLRLRNPWQEQVDHDHSHCDS